MRFTAIALLLLASCVPPEPKPTVDKDAGAKLLEKLRHDPVLCERVGKRWDCSGSGLGRVINLIQAIEVLRFKDHSEAVAHVGTSERNYQNDLGLQVRTLVCGQPGAFKWVHVETSDGVRHSVIGL